LDETIVNLKDHVGRDFSKYFFVKNPFPALTVPEENPRITADRKESIERFKHSVDQLTRHDESSILVFVGDYGSGKSHLLRIFSTAILEQLDNEDDGVFSFLIKSPGRNFLDYFIEAINGVGMGRMTKLSNKIVEEYIENNQKIVRNLVMNPFKEKFDSGKYNLEDLLEHTQVNNLFTNVRKETLKGVKENDIAYAMLYLAHPTTRSTAWNWFFGSSMSREDKNRIQIIDSNNDGRRAKMFLRDMASILDSVGYKQMVFFIDEFEKMSVLPNNQRKIFQESSIAISVFTSSVFVATTT